MSSRFLLTAACAALCFASTASLADTFLDTYLNNIKLDQKSGRRPKGSGAWQSKNLAAGHTLGQTFTTGPNVKRICRICVQSPHYSTEWGKGTSLVLSLYDGPGKAAKLAEFEMKYEWRQWEDMKIVFPIDVPAEPDHQYYFELSARGGDGKIGPIVIAPSDYPRGQGYEDGKPQEFDLLFEDYVRTDWDRDKSYQEAFGRINLDHPGLAKVKTAVAAKNWDTAARELVAHFESRTDLMEITQQPPDPRKPLPNADQIELAAQMCVKEANGDIISLGPNWNHLRWWANRGGVGLTREGIRKYLAAGYANTGDEKYAKAWTDLLKAFFTDLPSPIKAGIVSPEARDIEPIFDGGIDGGSMWAGLATAARIRHGYWYYKTFARSPNFPWDVRAAFILNIADMADVLAVQKGGGNWADQMNVGLFEFGTTFPEYARAKDYAQKGFDGLIGNMRATLLPDGPIGESAGYQGLVHGTYLSVLDEADRVGLKIPRDVYSNIERAFRFHLLTMQPDGGRPAFGDALGDTYVHLLKRAYDRYHRSDFLWGATGGKEGAAPKETSVEFPYSAYYVMRSDWTPDARYLCLKNGRYTSHGHFDSLGFVLYGFGSPLIVDPGVYIYGTPDTTRIQATRSHSTISVDEANLHNGGGPNQFFAGRGADFLIAQGPRYQGLPESIYTIRRMVFVKPDYWVVSDVVRGSGEHQVDSRFHFADTTATLDASTQVATTTRDTGGNLSVIPVDPSRISSSLDKADTAFVHEKLAPALIFRQSAKTTLPFRMDNVLVPFAGKSADARVSALSPSTPDSETSGAKIQTARGTDFALFTGGACRRVEFAAEGIAGSFQCATIRRDPSSKLTGFSWMWGTSLSHRDLLADSRRPVPGLDVVYDGDTVYVTTRGSDPSLRIRAFDAIKAVVNGSEPRPITPENGFFSPFSGPERDVVLVDDETAGFSIDRPIKGAGAGGTDQVGFSYYWCHVSPGRTSTLSYRPRLNSSGLYEVRAYVPEFRLVELTTDAHYVVSFKPGGRFRPSPDRRVRVADNSDTRAGRVHLRADQLAAKGTWLSLGAFEFDAASEPRVEIRADAAVGGPVLVADAVEWAKAW